ncbi:FecR/PupR family sigma factor regulator [Alteraurantiacibacter buctensis]|uniref:DUF4880 domain-containing protein n=1 Tax=Alteraurantiacibacter buctensis TaxID=1503981 RepID=A0A844Z171_9SPHN|nr:DUF4880 domain-containing protein [Alteraurantiacibacter buctensis]MXO73262.1 DUF4880 domain-containing protein [Alteraurantiacibacter buctensis]
MNTRTKEPGDDRDAPSREAAVWFARLRSGQGDSPAFGAWLDRDCANARAFARVLDGWDIVGGLAPLYPQFAPADPAAVSSPGRPRREPGLGAE